MGVRYLVGEKSFGLNMTRDKLLQIINLILENGEQKPVDTVDEGTKLRENLGLDSFCLAELTVRLEDETGIDVFADGLIDTVGEVLHRLGADG